MLRFDRETWLPTLSGADYVHDIAYDFYGTRFAICTSSLRISIFAASEGGLVGEEGETAPWTEIARMDRAHGGPIWRLSWGHPEHGQPLASCSEDCTVRIWHGGRGAANRGAESSMGSATTGPTVPPAWQQRWSHQGEGPWVDVRFAPTPLGLKLAAVTADGKARVFECVNALDLRTWEQEDIETQTSRLTAASFQPIQPGLAAATVGDGCMSAALDWMCVPYGGSSEERSEMIAVGGRGGRLSIWAKSNRWKELASDVAHPRETGGVKDVAWCPNLCRPYEIVATCGAGARLWRVDIPSMDETQGVTHARKDSGNLSCRLQLLMELMPATDKACPVWRCSWNLMGTTLALCPESGEVSIWKCNASLQWRRECEVEKGIES